MHTDQDINVAMVQTSIHEDQDGLATLTSQLCDSLASRGVHTTLVTRTEKDGKRAMVLPTRPDVFLHLAGRPPQTDSNRSTDRRTILCLSRIHRKKGLMHLVEAWNNLRPQGWRVVIAGQDDAGYRGELESAIRRFKLTDDFIFHGFVSMEEKAQLYREADLFVLPTYSENFGLVVPEALSHGIPVITTRGTPWEELNLYRCGWWTEIGTDPLTETLREALALPDSELKDMGLRGQKLVEERYSFSRLSEELKSLYQWLITGGEPPPFVIFDSLKT